MGGSRRDTSGTTGSSRWLSGERARYVDTVTPEQINAASGALSALAALAAVSVAAFSISEVRRIDQRAKTRETIERDEILQSRLEAMYPALYSVFGSPLDTIPLDDRPPVVSFFSLYADAYVAKRDKLLPEADVDSFLDEFAYWARTTHGRMAWAQLRDQTWPEGFAHHVDRALLNSDPYAQLGYLPPVTRWLHGGLSVHYLEALHPPELATAWDTLVALEARGIGSIPPTHLAGDRENTLAWLMDRDARIWGRWTAMLGSRAVGHVAVSEPHAYLDDRLAPGSRWLEISRLFVDPMLQGNGVGFDLMNQAVRFVHGVGARAILVFIEDDQLLNWYQRQGWREAGSFHGIQGTNVIMQLVPAASAAISVKPQES